MAACPKATQTHTNPIPNWETAYADHPHKISPDKNRPAKFAVTKSGLQDHQPSLCRQEAAYSNPGAKITVSFPVKATCISRPNDQPPLKPIESGFKKLNIPRPFPTIPPSSYIITARLLKPSLFHPNLTPAILLYNIGMCTFISE